MEKRVFRLNEICKIKSGKRIPKGMDYVTYQTSHPYIRARDIKSGKIFTDDLIYIKDEVYKKIRKYIIQKGDIAITVVGASVGDTGYATESVDGYNLTENAVRLTNFTEDVDSKFLHYVLMQKHYYDYMQLIAGAAAQPKLGIYKIQKIRVVLPKVSIQKRIADILTTYDNLIENNNKRIKLLEQMAENLYKEWFVRFRFPGYENSEFENGIPKGWEILRANQLFDITIGKTPDRKIFEYFSNNPECNYPWVSISDMRSASTFVFKTKEYLTFNAVNTCNVKIIPKNTVIVSFKLTVGQVAITTSDMCTNEAIAHFTTDNAAMREYIYLYLKNFQYSDLGNTSSIGTAVNSKIIKNMKIILPSSEILSRFHDSTYSIFEEIRLLNETNNNLTKQLDMLLPRLMSGKLEV